MDSKKIKKIVNIIDKREPVVILTHSNPDGDAVGSSIALGLALRKSNIPVNIIIPDAIPVFLEWLPGNDLITIHKDNQSAVTGMLSEAKIIFCLDFNDPDRINAVGEMVKQSAALKVLIDHHRDPSDFADITYSEPWRGSAGEMIYLFIKKVFGNDILDKDIATALYVAIMTDTGNFRYGCSYPEIFHIAGELMQFPIDKDEIYAKVYENFSADRMRLMGYCLHHKMVVLPEYNTAYIALSSAELRRFNYRKGDTEGFVNIPLSIDGIRFTALFIEKRNIIKVSFRSKGNFPANEFAEKHFNGGGHLNAAGGELKDSMKECIEKFVNLLPEYEEALGKA
ncbi:MAG: bifunctional oligoribonuclease/PAP phosphatase NrnA [Bacteroidales bacterium]|nr:bifunctional oligoribonuclease/PAP phosphatase NrnA [Bacteroidales bacterium]